MRILFIVDGRSPIALNWMRYFCEGKHEVHEVHEVHLVSTYPCEPELKLASFHMIPAAFGDLGKKGIGARAVGVKGLVRRVIPVGVRTGARQWLGPLTLPRAAKSLRALVAQIQPDLVHAMRIPYEGMLAALADPAAPLLISVWGNDFTLHASSNPWMAAYTRLAMRRASALHADCHRDSRLALEWGFPSGRLAIILPGNGGVQLNVFYPPTGRTPAPVIINPRGFRAYVRSDTFFQAVPGILARLPQARFLCPGMAGEPQALRWLDEYGISQAVELLPLQSRQQMAELFRQAQVAVSPSTHDGTPNTLLEAMACGCFPVAGDIESLREWITPGENGFLIDPGDADALSNAILKTFAQPELVEHARKINHELISKRAEYKAGMLHAGQFYTQLLEIKQIPKKKP